MAWCNVVLIYVVIAVVAVSISADLCTVPSLRQSFDIGGIYFRAIPPGWCKPINKNLDIEFRVYPAGSSPKSLAQRISIKDDDEKLKSLFKPNLPTAVYIHGFFEGAKSSSVRSFRFAFLLRKDYNIITVNWQKLANAPWYPSAVNNYPLVAREVVLLLDRLIEIGIIKIETLHLLGFSLGCHICGMVGRNLAAGRPARITALDPALPLVNLLPRNMRLDNTTANFVDVIHTCGGLYGLLKPVGHVDFYPNAGTYIQPGCAITLAPITCSHWRSWKFFLESMQGGEFISTKCDSWEDFRQNKCEDNQKILMGIDVDQTARGSFYLRTSWESPFALLE